MKLPETPNKTAKEQMPIERPKATPQLEACLGKGVEKPERSVRSLSVFNNGIDQPRVPEKA